VRVAVTGSIATDHLMTFPGKFADQLLADKLDKVSVSFLVSELQVRRGGVAGNIAFGLGCLGQRPLLVGSVGPDFAEYRGWLEAHGVDTSGVRTSATQHTARFVCTNDLEGNQIASFYPGAMSEDREIDVADLAVREGADLVLIGAGDPAGMQRYTADCRRAGIPFAADFSQQVAFLDGESIRPLVDGAAYLFGNDYEEAVIERKTGWSAAEILDRVDVRVTTLGADGTRVDRAGAEPVIVGPIPDAQLVEPTGTGDAFRCGFLAAVSWDLSLERAAQLGNLMAVHALETVGPQEYLLKQEALLDRFAAAYGAPAAEEVAACLG
jgi:adenosine kinase